MKRVSDETWKEYEIGKYFEIVKGKRLTKANMRPGNVRFIGSSAYNNGTTAYISNSENRHKGNLITVCYNGSVGETFYQEDEFIVSDDVNVLYPKFKMTKYVALFLCPIIKTKGKCYEFVDKWTKDKMEKSKLLLPVGADGEPDWIYMETYMKSIEAKVKDSIPKLEAINECEKKRIDINSFKRFHLYDEGLFFIDSGTKLDRIKMSDKNPSINFVGRANANNGVTDFIDRIDGIEPYEAGLMTVSLGGEYLGSCFIQDKPFYTSQNVNVLIPQKPISYYCKKYIATMVFKEGRLHYKAFIDELNRHMKTDFTIPLPVDSNGNPDWNYMEKYMRDIEKVANNNIRLLTI